MKKVDIGCKHTRRKLRKSLLAVSLTVMIGLAASLRMPGLNPQSLWLDDAWAALILRTNSWAEFRLVVGSTPVGFALLLKLAALVIPDLELAAQIFPFLAGLALIPMVGISIWKVSRNLLLSGAGAFMAAVSPLMGVYSLRVKQFTMDSLLTGLFLLFVIFLLDNREEAPGWRRILSAGLLSIFLGLFSYASLFFSGPATGALFLEQKLNIQDQKGKQHKGSTAVFAAYLAGLALYYLLVLRSQTNPNLQGYWADFFPPYGQGAGAVLSYLCRGVVFFITSAFPLKLGLPGQLLVLGMSVGNLFLFVVIAAFMAVALIRFWIGMGRALGLSLVGFYILPIILTLLQVYPFGENAWRVILYSYPITWFTFFSGCGIVYDTLLQKLGHAVPDNESHLIRILRLKRAYSAVLGGALVLMAVRISSGLMHAYTYPTGEQCVSDAVRVIESSGAGAIIYPVTGMAFGLYTSGDVHFVPDENYSAGFRVETTQEDLYLLPFIRGFRDRPSLLDSSLGDIPYDEHDAIYYLESHMGETSSEYIVETILGEGGYGEDVILHGDDCRLILFTR